MQPLTVPRAPSRTSELKKNLWRKNEEPNEEPNEERNEEPDEEQVRSLRQQYDELLIIQDLYQTSRSRLSELMRCVSDANLACGRYYGACWTC